MAHEPRFSTAPTQQDVDRIIAQAHQMRAEFMAQSLRKLARGIAGPFQRPGKAADVAG